jgi:hypothetical protein
MNKVIIDQHLRSQLNGLDASIELCDESGKTLGHFLPENVYREVMAAWGKVLFPDEEVEEAEREDDEDEDCSLAEIWESLGNK